MPSDFQFCSSFCVIAVVLSSESETWELGLRGIDHKPILRYRGCPGPGGSRLEGCGGGAEALLGSLDRVWDPEVPIRPRGLFLRSGDRIGALMHLDPEAFEAMLEPGGLDPEIVFWNPEEPGGSSLDPEIFDWNPEAIGEPGGSSLDFMRRTRNRLGNLGFPL
ncbi:hypothetical protein F2Q70_00029295 [Brassica cretica]|uniref:Uncharacterized protein n=1 Tax=Brassica cretica TaxID=69181 RepID=A0A8S9FIX0_BRACR|nr:hypothetical protein F2Q70_00029295 [Brassica cretica]